MYNLAGIWIRSRATRHPCRADLVVSYKIVWSHPVDNHTKTNTKWRIYVKQEIFFIQKKYAQLSCVNDVWALKNVSQKVSQDMKWGHHNISYDITPHGFPHHMTGFQHKIHYTTLNKILKKLYGVPRIYPKLIGGGRADFADDGMSTIMGGGCT